MRYTRPQLVILLLCLCFEHFLSARFAQDASSKGPRYRRKARLTVPGSNDMSTEIVESLIVSLALLLWLDLQYGLPSIYSISKSNERHPVRKQNKTSLTTDDLETGFAVLVFGTFRLRILWPAPGDAAHATDDLFAALRREDRPRAPLIVRVEVKGMG